MEGMESGGLETTQRRFAPPFRRGRTSTKVPFVL